jgi:trigger factor
MTERYRGRGDRNQPITLDAARLTHEIVEHPAWRRTMAVTVPDALVRVELDRALQRLAGRVKLPGFRKGKAPLAVVERQYGAPVRRETLQRVIDAAYQAALAERSIQPVTEGEVESVEYEPETGLVFRISFDARPEVELARLGGFRVERPAATVRTEQVDAALEGLREEHALWRPVDDQGGPGEGDLVTVRILPLSESGEPHHGSGGDVGLPWARRLRLRAGTEHRGRYQLVIGAGDAVPALEAAIRALLPGETRDVAIPLPDDAGVAAERRLRVTLEDRQVKDLPDLDDAFARSLGDFDDVTALRAKLEDDLRAEASDRVEAVLRARLLDLVVDANPFDVPASMVDRYVDGLVGDTARADADAAGRMRAGLRPQAERAVKRMLVLERIAELHGLEATGPELEARVAEIAARGQVGPGQVRDQLVRTGRLERLAGDITNTKVFDFLKGQSQIVDEKGEVT